MTDESKPRLLITFPHLLQYCELSFTFKQLYEAGVRESVSLGIATKEAIKNPKINTIYLPEGVSHEEKVTPDDAVLLAHELRHAIQEIDDPVEGEHDAYKYQSIVRNELIAAGCELTPDSEPLTTDEINEIYIPYYADA